MNIKNLLTLTIRTVDFNLAARQPELIAKLRALTLNSRSGLNVELNRMLRDVERRTVNCQLLLAYRFRTLVGWCIVSKESTHFIFPHTMDGFRKEDGRMFQVFVNPAYRRQGIASELFKKAQRLAGDETICVCPWDDRSRGFYEKFPNAKTKWI